MRFGPWEIIIIVIIIVLIFGGKKLAGLGKALGTSVREFKEEVKGDDTAKAETSESDKEKTDKE